MAVKKSDLKKMIEDADDTISSIEIQQSKIKKFVSKVSN